MIVTPSRTRRLLEIAAEYDCSYEFVASLFSYAMSKSENECYAEVIHQLSQSSFNTKSLLEMHFIKYDRQIIFVLYDMIASRPEHQEDLDEYTATGRWTPKARTLFAKEYFKKLIPEADWLDFF